MFRFYVACLLLSLASVDSATIGQDTALQLLDLDDWSQNQVIVDREPGQYLGLFSRRRAFYRSDDQSKTAHKIYLAQNTFQQW